MTTIGAAPRPAGTDLSYQQSGRVLAALVLAVMSYGLMQTMLVPTVGVLQRDLHTSPAGASWAVLSATLVTSAAVTPLIGRLADRHGRRRILLVCLVIYLVGILGAAMAPGVAVLIVFRAVQGVSLALVPLSFAIIHQVLPAERVAGGLAVTSGVVGGTAGLGLLIGGVLVDHTSWRFLFVVGAAITVIAIVATWRWVPSTPGRPSGRLDLPGTVVLAAGMVSLLLAITEGPRWGWLNVGVVALFVLAVMALLLFALIERRTRHPLIDLGLLRHRPLLVAHLAALTLGLNQFVFYVLLPRLSELPSAHGGYGFGASVTTAALILLPGTLVTLPASWCTGWIERVLGPGAALVLGLGLAAAGGLSLALWHDRVGQVIVWYLVCSAGYGLTMAALPRTIHRSSDVSVSGSVNGINTVGRTLGGAIGSQVAAAIITSYTHAAMLPQERGFTVAFTFAAAAAAAGTVVAMFARQRRPA